MFDEESLKKIDSTYFNIILADDRDVTIQSRNTGHYWYLHCAGYPTEQALVIFHKHQFNHPYHQHGHAGSLGKAMQNITVILHRHSLISIPFIPATCIRFLRMLRMRTIPSRMSLMRWQV